MQRRIALAALTLSVLMLPACSSNDAGQDDSTRDDDGDVVEGGEVGAFRLSVGDCLAAEAVGDVESVPVVPCSEPHDSELFHSFQLADGEYPGNQSVIDQAQAGCIAEFDAFIGLAYAESVWDITAVYPTEASWNAVGDREVLCGVFPISDEDTTGSARGIAE